MKEGDALSLLFFKFALAYVIRRIQVKQEVLKLNGTHQLLPSAGELISNVKKSTLT